MINKTKVCLLPEGIGGWSLTANEIVDKYLLFETDTELNMGEPFKYKEKCYFIASKWLKDGIITIREFTEKNCEAVNFDGEITCPYCGTKDSDSWESGDGEDEQICDICGSTFSWQKEIEVTYSSQPIKKAKIKTIENK